jgi:molybdopterin converting factor small subunit
MADDTRIKVSLFGGLDMRSPRGDVREEHTSVGTVQGLITALKLEDKVVGTVLINGMAARRDATLAAGDQVALFPPRG